MSDREGELWREIEREWLQEDGESVYAGEIKRERERERDCL